ncbi:MAG: ester cyclase [Pseudomonadota bacterium]
MQRRPFAPLILISALLAFGAIASEAPPPTPNVSDMRQISAHMGEMTMSTGSDALDDTLRFEPYQQIDEMFLRNDVVFVMRHGPTDWSKLDQKNVAPTDCANQRVMVEEGIARMRGFGQLMAENGIVPSQIVVSEWCRNQQTLDALMAGFDAVDPEISPNMPVETVSDVNLLLSLQGSATVSGLAARVSAWDGHPTRSGPLLIITHYTNIEELTQFRVFEGETLVVDPKRDNLVLGYIRLRSAAPDIGHFAETLASPLLTESQALSMVERYYAAFNANDFETVSSLLAETWVGHGVQGRSEPIDEEGLRRTMMQYRQGLSDGRFEVVSVHVAEDVITVLGRITGTHTGAILGVQPTRRKVAFDGIAVHRIADGAISESWLMADRLSLLKQISKD